MLLANLDHGGQNIVPGLLLQHNIVGKHTAVPTNVFKSFGQITIFISQPEAGVRRNIQFSVWIRSQAVTPCFVVRSRSVYRSVVLRYVEVQRPRP
jgi:hypothetical protein